DFTIHDPVDPNAINNKYALTFQGAVNGVVPGSILTIVETPDSPLHGYLFGAQTVTFADGGSGVSANVLSVSSDGKSLTVRVPKTAKSGNVTVHTVGFSRAVTELNVVTDGTPSSSITFLYIVAAGDSANPLDYNGTGALTLPTTKDKIESVNLIKVSPFNVT